MPEDPQTCRLENLCTNAFCNMFYVTSMCKQCHGYPHCKICWDLLNARGTRCGGGHTPDGVVKDKSMMKVLQEATVKCQHHADGCGWQGQVNDQFLHLSSCKVEQLKDCKKELEDCKKQLAASVANTKACNVTIDELFEKIAKMQNCLKNKNDKISSLRQEFREKDMELTRALEQKTFVENVVSGFVTDIQGGLANLEHVSRPASSRWSPQDTTSPPPGFAPPGFPPPGFAPPGFLPPGFPFPDGSPLPPAPMPMSPSLTGAIPLTPPQSLPGTVHASPVSSEESAEESETEGDEEVLKTEATFAFRHSISSQTFPDVYRGFQTFENVFSCLQMSSGCLQTFWMFTDVSDVHRHFQMFYYCFDPCYPSMVNRPARRRRLEYVHYGDID